MKDILLNFFFMGTPFSLSERITKLLINSAGGGQIRNHHSRLCASGDMENNLCYCS